MTASNERCAICLKNITQEIPNDWNENLCFKCAQKEHFNNRKGSLDKEQRLLFDNYKH